MNKPLFLAAALTVVVSFGVFAQAYSVSYVDGVAELRTAKGWTALSIGDQVSSDASVRISQSGSLELQKGKARITLLKDGTYDMASLSKATDKAGAGGIGTAISQKLQSLTTEKAKGGTVGGVRGAEQGGGGDVTWVDENDETRTQAQSLIDQKKFKEAVALLNQAINDARGDADKEELTYLIGTAYYDQGQTARAYRALSTISPQPDASWYARYVILKSQVLVDTMNYRDALGLLSPFITAYPTGEATQVAYLLTYYCQKGLGDQASARGALDAGFKLDPGTDAAKMIDQQRKAQ
jgi:tetratricopeptide (TPR) repeat protein